MKNHTNKLILAFVMMFTSINAMENKDVHNNDYANKAVKDWNQNDLDAALKYPKKLQSLLFESDEAVEFSTTKFNPESLNTLKRILKEEAIIGMNGANVSFIRPFTKGLLNNDELSIRDTDIHTTPH